MTRLVGIMIVGWALTLCVGGCDSKVENITVKASNDPLHEPRSILKRYAAGQAPGSEVSTYSHLVANVRKVDATRADVLEKGLQQIQKASPSERQALAKALLKKLAPSMK